MPSAGDPFLLLAISKPRLPAVTLATPIIIPHLRPNAPWRAAGQRTLAIEPAASPVTTASL